MRNNRLILVFDTSAFLSKYHLQLPVYAVSIYTVPRVVGEVRDLENRQALELGLSMSIINVKEPEDHYRRQVLIHAGEIGEHVKLSETDIDVAALALELKNLTGSEVVVLTDDYSLQNLLYHMDISFKPIRTAGIKKKRRYTVYCPVCGYVPSNKSEKICPICGSRLVHRAINDRFF